MLCSLGYSGAKALLRAEFEFAILECNGIWLRGFTDHFVAVLYI